MLNSRRCIYLYSSIDDSTPLYIGKSIARLGKRHASHMNYKSVPFDTIATKMGWHTVKLEVLEKNIPLDELSLRERFYYLKYRPLHNCKIPCYSDEDKAEQLRRYNIYLTNPDAVFPLWLSPEDFEERTRIADLNLTPAPKIT